LLFRSFGVKNINELVEASNRLKIFGAVFLKLLSAAFRHVVHDGTQEVSEEKALQKLYETLT
jgi:hypothetical protein